MPTVTPYIDAATIGERIAQLGVDIGKRYRDRPLTLLCCLKGAYFFTADLSRTLAIPHRVSFVRASSYGHGTVSSGEVRFARLEVGELEGRDVLVVEDIVDTGRTASLLMERLVASSATSVKLCALLDKPSRRETGIVPDYVGFTIEDHFVVGYGLDHAEEYRHLPYLALLELDQSIR